jgi:hypothetical protein
MPAQMYHLSQAPANMGPGRAWVLTALELTRYVCQHVCSFVSSCCHCCSMMISAAHVARSACLLAKQFLSNNTPEASEHPPGESPSLHFARSWRHPGLSASDPSRSKLCCLAKRDLACCGTAADHPETCMGFVAIQACPQSTYNQLGEVSPAATTVNGAVCSRGSCLVQKLWLVRGKHQHPIGGSQ